MKRKLSLSIEEAAALYFNLKLVSDACISGTGNDELDRQRQTMQERILKLYPEIKEILTTGKSI